MNPDEAVSDSVSFILISTVSVSATLSYTIIIHVSIFLASSLLLVLFAGLVGVIS